MAELVVALVDRLAVFSGAQVALNGLLHRLEDLGIANRLLEVFGGYHDDTIAVGMNGVTWCNTHGRSGLTRQQHRDIDSGVVPQSLGSERRRERAEHRHRVFREFGQIAYAAVGDDATTTAQFPTQCDVAADHRTGAMSRAGDHRDTALRHVPV